MERIVAAPQEFSEVLDICADFVRAAVRNGGGNILVFLPGFDAILRLESLLDQLMEPWDAWYQTQRLHSDALGLEVDEQKPEEADDRCTLVVLSSVIAARGVTLPDIHYVFIHPYCRKTLLHQSGCEVLGEEMVDAELLSNIWPRRKNEARSRRVLVRAGRLGGGFGGAPATAESGSTPSEGRRAR